MFRFAIVFLAAASLAFADERSQRLALRLAEEAAAFGRVAPRVVGRESLEQRAQKPPGRFRIRVGKAATQPAEPEWQTRKIDSEYGFTTFASDGSLHELHQVTAVDGKAVKNGGPEALARIILASDDSRKRELLKQFEEHGLIGAVTDFGPLILLFAPGNIVRYEFTFRNVGTLRGVPVEVFGYKQIDGPNALTFIDKESNETKALEIRGEIWVRGDTYVPVRITLASESGALRQEAIVDYAMSRFGAVLPAATSHRELRNGKLAAENNFIYSDFRRFGASADIVFETGDSPR